MKTSILILSLLLTAVAQASSVTYNVSLNTSAVAASNGAIYLNFSPGLGANLGSVEVSDFLIAAPGSLTGSPTTTGDVSGALPGQVHFVNTFATNDYLHALQYGNSLSFRVSFQVANNAAVSGSALSFGLTAADGLTPVLTNDPAGFIGVISYDGSGAFTSAALDPAAVIIPAAVPEPATTIPVVVALLALGGFNWRNRRLQDGVAHTTAS